MNFDIELVKGICRQCKKEKYIGAGGRCLECVATDFEKVKELKKE